jgi:hypothetical protein
MMDRIHSKNNEQKEVEGQYKCEECEIDFGNSIGDMERHKLTAHLQR